MIEWQHWLLISGVLLFVPVGILWAWLHAESVRIHKRVKRREELRRAIDGE